LTKGEGRSSSGEGGVDQLKEVNIGPLQTDAGKKGIISRSLIYYKEEGKRGV